MDAQRGLRALPKVDEVLGRPGVVRLEVDHGRARVRAAVREVIEAARQALLAGRLAPEGVPGATDDQAVAAAVGRLGRTGLQPVINATGVVLHTNLGRAPLAPAALAAAAEAAGYGSLEIDLETGQRGRRESHLSKVAAELLGCEAATAVNNCAAAVMLVLRTLAEGREVVVSRGELVEIGGGFRVPEVLAQSGARLVEVGTTNRTRIADYARAITSETAVLLKIHRSNFAMVGFTEEASLEELAALARERGVTLVHDLGSGLPGPDAAVGPLEGEETARESLAAGADLVCFSGDKLLGGPQAGIIAGRGELVQRCHAHPLMRALRCDKLTLAALEATLIAWRDGQGAHLPVHAMLQAAPDALRSRADRLVAGLARAGLAASLMAVDDAVGGGSAPLARMPGWAVEVETADPDALAAALRRGSPAVVGVVQGGRLRLHVRTVTDAEVPALAEAVGRAASR